MLCNAESGFGRWSRTCTKPATHLVDGQPRCACHTKAARSHNVWLKKTSGGKMMREARAAMKPVTIEPLAS